MWVSQCACALYKNSCSSQCEASTSLLNFFSLLCGMPFMNFSLDMHPVKPNVHICSHNIPMMRAFMIQQTIVGDPIWTLCLEFSNQKNSMSGPLRSSSYVGSIHCFRQSRYFLMPRSYGDIRSSLCHIGLDKLPWSSTTCPLKEVGDATKECASIPMNPLPKWTISPQTFASFFGSLHIHLSRQNNSGNCVMNEWMEVL